MFGVFFLNIHEHTYFCQRKKSRMGRQKVLILMILCHLERLESLIVSFFMRHGLNTDLLIFHFDNEVT